MENKITKNLIILGAIIFTLAFTNQAQAYCQRYAFSNKLVDRHCVEENDYYQNYETSSTGTTSYNDQTSSSKTSVVNNYYYPTKYVSPEVATNTNTSTANKTVDNYSNSNTGKNVYSNSLGASAYDSNQTGNGITALSLRGSGSFMPSSIWQWILVVILILIIIIIARMFVRKPNPADHDNHVVHAH